jgi:hypothetical protein
MRHFLLVTMLAWASLQTPQTNNGVIEGKVVRVGSSQGIAAALIRLTGPYSTAALSTLYTPNPSLTPAMREQIDDMINSRPGGIEQDVVFAANAARLMEAQLLGLPAPALLEPATQPSETRALTDSTGSFAFRNLAPGRYQIWAQQDGYFRGTPSTLG